ncbi:32439_t:CDS:1, partial [Gigaspora margarita]
TIRNIVKDLFNNDKEILFPPDILLKRSSEDAKYYVISYRRCKIHHKTSEKKYCKCYLYDLNDLGNCKLYTIECCKQRKKEQLNELGSGPFEFGQYRLLLESTDDTVNAINNSKLENIN